MVTDMEAGLEHLSRATTRASDVMLVIAEPYYKSLETAARVKQMADELGIPNSYIVANKVRSQHEQRALEAFAAKHGLPILVTVPYDEQIAAASLIPQAPLDFAPDSAGVVAVATLADMLITMHRKVAP